jgi:anti-sigma-K factor RskA
MNAGGQHFDTDGCGGNAAPYMLGALTEEESVAFRRHLESCAICREEVAALQVVAAALPAAAPPLSAPSTLKRRVMSAVHEDARVVPAMRSNLRKRRSRPSWRPRSLLPIPRAAIAGLGAAAVIVLAVIALASSGGGGTRVIRAQVLAPRASAQLRLSAGHAELTIAGMPQPAPGRTYEVWLQGSGPPRPTDALFTVTSAGDASVGIPGGVSGVREILVTSEPRGGSRVPTRPPVIIAHLS